MSTLTIRGCDEQLTRALHAASQERGLSINRLVLETLDDRFGQGARKRRHDDLDHLAGTWSPEEAAEFAAATQIFEQIDPEDWR
jgi:hypothetical protein